MAPTATKPTAKKATKPKPAPAPEPEELEEDVAETEDDELAELEEDAVEEIEEEAKPAAKKGAKKAAAKKSTAPAFGTKELAAHISEETGKEYDAKSIRVLLRKIAPKLNRVVGESHERYAFTGPDDEQVKLIVKMVKRGDLEKEKKAALDKLKENQAAKKAAKKAATVEEVEEVEELDSDEEDGDEE